MAKITQLASGWTKIQSQTTKESEQAKDTEAFWESALVASAGRARLDLNLSPGLRSPSLSLECWCCGACKGRGSITETSSLLHVGSFEHEGQEWGQTVCLKLFTRIWGS